MINTNNDIIEISNYARCWDWEPEWIDVQKIYNQFPDSYSILTPFAYSYLEQLIRSTTSEYGERPFENDGSPKRYTVGYPLVELAIKENIHNPEYVKLLEKAKEFFNRVDVLYEGM